MTDISVQIKASSIEELQDLLGKLQGSSAQDITTISIPTGETSAVADTSHSSFNQPPITAPATPAESQATLIPTASPEYTLAQLANAAALFTTQSQQNYDAGMNLLAKYGATMLTDLPKEHYGNFATELRQLGAQI